MAKLLGIGLIVNILFQLRIQHFNFPLDFRLLGLVSVCERHIVCIRYQSGSVILKQLIN